MNVKTKWPAPYEARCMCYTWDKEFTFENPEKAKFSVEEMCLTISADCDWDMRRVGVPDLTDEEAESRVKEAFEIASCGTESFDYGEFAIMEDDVTHDCSILFMHNGEFIWLCGCAAELRKMYLRGICGIRIKDE